MGAVESYDIMLESWRDQMALDFYLGIQPGESMCSDHGNWEERGRQRFRQMELERRAQMGASQGTVTGYVEFNLDTREITFHDLPHGESSTAIPS